MLKRLLVTLLAVVLVIPVTGLQVHAEELPEEIQIQEVNEEVNNNEIITDDSYNVEIVEEVVEENQEEVVIDNDAQVEVEQELEQEITTDEVIQEETTEEVKEVTTDVVDETLVEEQVEEELKEEEPAPLMLMAAPKMAMLSLGKSKDPTAQTDTYPIYLNIKLTEYTRGKYIKNVSYTFENNQWVAIIDDNLTTVNCVTGYQLDIDNTGSVNNVYVECTYNPLVDGTFAKFYQKDKSGEEPRREYASSRYASTCVKMKTNWIRYAMYGYGRQERTTGAWAANMLTDEDDIKQICRYRGYIAVNAENADMSQIKEEGGIYGTFSFVVNLSREGFANFSQPSS